MLKRLTRPETAPPWSILTVFGAVIAMFAAIVIGTILAESLLENSPQRIMTGWSIGMVLTIFFVLVTRRDTTMLRISPTRTSLLLILMGMLGVAITFDLISAIVTGNQNIANAELLNFEDVNIFGWIIALLFLVVLQPIGEELVFRGMAFPALRSSLGPWATLLMCAALHAVFHFAAYPPSPENQTILLWYGLGLPFLDGLAISAVRAGTGSTRAAIVAHAALGLFAVLKVIALS